MLKRHSPLQLFRGLALAGFALASALAAGAQGGGAAKGGVPAVQTPVKPPASLAAWACTGTCGSSGPAGDIGLPPGFSAGSHYGYLSTYTDVNTSAGSPIVPSGFTNSNGSRIVSPAFNATAGSTIDVWFDYITTDGRAFSDYAWARLVNQATGASTYLFAARASGQNSGKVIPGGVLPTAQFDPVSTIVGYSSWKFNKTVGVRWEPLVGLASVQACFANGTCGNTGWVNARVSVPASGDYKLEFGVTNVNDNVYNSGLAFAYAGIN